MFVPALMGHASEEQQARWLPDALTMRIIGSYAQTELGHGTFIRGLETTATYDEKTQEFVLETPKLSSIKWWPGSLGKTANHAVVMAKLWTKGECHGIHPFMVQLRDLDTHEPLPGINVGEIGPKMGMRSADNGFLKLDMVRIPRENMLMKNAQVSVDGTYHKPASDKLNYGTMVFVRVLLLDMLAFNISRAVTIAIRYSAVRRQSEIIAGAGETQILDYQAQRYKLFPLISLCHVLRGMFAILMEMYKQANTDLERGVLDTLPELHAVSSGLKALCSDMAAKGIEVCRLACGGHGYLLVSGLPRLYATTVAACTYEGENTVLYLQTSRFLLKCLTKQHKLGNSSQLRFLLDPVAPSITRFNPDLYGLDGASHLVQFHAAAAYRELRAVDAKLKRLQETEGLSAAQACIQYYLAKNYVQWVARSQVSPELRHVLAQLAQLYLLQCVYEHSGRFLQAGLTSEDLTAVSSLMTRLLDDLRPNAVPLVDSFDLHDMVLSSALGSYDGQVYDRMYECALQAPLNNKQVVDAYGKYLEPLFKNKF
ncbi:peroxisomal acyl-coenzyme A oxidase 1-like [Tropilaelaps mercedesae]|uniref:Peroxisomal acyl-coenzyme A oxidase 1-like n=1 Tax=Tropilaelaps mercedesae TaxID=418985 RepID=A0A1V9Y0B5_9ACAR|nr:peroxisomal acyl-coenzyme A oxidase 1-like [Tropilaelaps mercedesae]